MPYVVKLPFKEGDKTYQPGDRLGDDFDRVEHLIRYDFVTRIPDAEYIAPEPKQLERMRDRIETLEAENVRLRKQQRTTNQRVAQLQSGQKARPADGEPEAG